MEIKLNYGSVYNAVMGDVKIFNIAHRTYNALTLIFGFFSLLMVPVAYIHENIYEAIILLICSCFFTFLYFKSRLFRQRKQSIFILSTQVLFAMILYLSGGFKSYGIFLYIISFIATVVVEEDRSSWFGFYVTMANLALLYLVQLFYPNITRPVIYSSQTMMLIFFVLILLVLNLIATSLKKNFMDNDQVIHNQIKEFENLLKNVTSSVQYASNIQNALLPKAEKLKQILPEHFVLYKPRDIVSGDFYWVEQIGTKTVVIAADCTGHGVPGAFMSMLGISLLNEIVLSKQVLKSNEILNQLREQVKRNIPDSKDGMDIAVLVLDKAEMKVDFAGANNPLYLFRDGELTEYKGNRQPVGRYAKETDFTSHELEVRTGDRFYLFSDGYYDQVGGENKKKFLLKNFRELLKSIQDLSLDEQKDELETVFEDWKNASGLKHRLTFNEIETIYFLLNENVLQDREKRMEFRDRMRVLEYYNIENMTKIIADCYTPELADEIHSKLKTSGNQVDDVLVIGFKI